MLDGVHKDEIGVLTSVHVEKDIEEGKAEYDFVFPDGSEHVIDSRIKPKSFRRYREN